MSAADTIWEDLVTSVLLGTDRRPPQPPLAGDALSERIQRLDPAQSPSFLLGAAALVTQYRQAGRLLAQIALPAPSVCPPEDRPACSPAAALRLKMMLGGSYKEILPEWLALAAERGKRVPAELLPELLSWADPDTPSIDSVLAVIGQRGRWLLTQNPGWEDVLLAETMRHIQPAAAEAAWQTGKRAARQALLRCVRVANPALGLQLVASTWKEDSALDRTSFLNIFTNGLSMADEPFLEAALDDRSKEVRRAACDLLGGLGESRLVQRHYQRLQALLKFQPGNFLRKPKLEVILPEACDKDMLRDGVEVKRQTKTRGEKGEWLAQMLRTVPPTWWSRDWKESPEGILTTASQGDWEELLRESWVSAAVAHRDLAWAEALLKRYPDEEALIAILQPQQREAFFLSQLEANFDVGLDLLSRDEHAWSKDLSLRVLEGIRKYHAANLATFDYTWRKSFPALGRHMQPALAAEINRLLANPSVENPNWDGVVESLLLTVDFRRLMLDELSL
jgi:hypothetical protein